MTNDEILAEIRGLADRLGKTELTVKNVEDNLVFGLRTLIGRWGSARAAFEAAGLSSTKLGHRYTDEECFDNLLAVWTHHGRPPQYREMSEPPSKVGGEAYVKRFGTWNKALAAFVERVNADPDSAATGQPSVSEPSALGAPSQVSESDTRDRRDIPLGLRFRVLHRDRFKCVLCGDSPSRNLCCVLHVDHVIPWSRGGKTAADNLRTLCGTCNVGRSNRYDD
jgi:hypothetical protein